jgi:FlaA1/EpsC-like NDP-sugar epimerase
MKFPSFAPEMKNLIYLKKHAPRWLILILDLLISLFSLFFAYLLRFNFDVRTISIDFFLKSLAVVIITRLIFFTATKSYAGIIRYTGTKDAVRIIFVIAATNFTFVILNYINFFFIDPREYLIPFSVIGIDFFICIFAMTSYRLIVKALYFEAGNNPEIHKHCLVVGIGQNALTLKRIFYQNFRQKYKIEAFLDPENKTEKKQVDGIPIYKISNLETVLSKHAIDELYFADSAIAPRIKNETIEICLDHNIKTFTAPRAEEWIDGTINVRQIREINIEDLLERAPIKLDNKAIESNIRGKRILVTGAAGSIGSETVMQLIPFRPEMIIVLDQAESPLYDLELKLREKKNFYDFKIVIGNIADPIRMRKVFEVFKPQAVFHAAAYKHVPMMEENPYEAVKTNIFGTKNIADLSLEKKVEKFVMVSTDKAVNPTNIMGATKRVAEIYTQALNNAGGTKFITTRFGNVLGSNGSVIQRFKEQIKSGESVTVTHPEVTRFFMTIPEACQLILQADALGKGGEIFIFDMGRSVKIVDLAKKMIKLYGFKLGEEIMIKFTGLRPGEKLFEELLNDKENTMPTSHSKIMAAKVRHNELGKISRDLDELYEITKTHNNFKIVGKLKAIVPEFISKNSIYENLDQTI